MRLAVAMIAAALMGAGCRSGQETDTRPGNGHLPDERGLERSPDSGRPIDPAPADVLVRDPVSGAMVDRARARVYRHEGRDYYFETDENLRAFKDSPRTYTPRDARPAEPGQPRPAEQPRPGESPPEGGPK